MTDNLTNSRETILMTKDGRWIVIVRANYRSMLEACNRDGEKRTFMFDHLEAAIDWAGIEPHELPKPRLCAVASSPRNRMWQVRLRYLGLLDREQHDMPAFDLPAENYEHAKKIVDAFNSKA